MEAGINLLELTRNCTRLCRKAASGRQMAQMKTGSPAWIQTTNLTGFEIPQVTDSTKSLKSSKASKAGFRYKGVPKSLASCREGIPNEIPLNRFLSSTALSSK
jgi:hypothetical protein